jgi:hypothetical protein
VNADLFTIMIELRLDISERMRVAEPLSFCSELLLHEGGKGCALDTCLMQAGSLQLSTREYSQAFRSPASSYCLSSCGFRGLGVKEHMHMQ